MYNYSSEVYRRHPTHYGVLPALDVLRFVLAIL